MSSMIDAGHRSGYRPDIDGLRAIAVVSVLLFHAGFTSFSGGFVGVDVFFVISGYLITRLIHDEVQSGTFTYRGFYLRRARRLLPALLFTVMASFLAGIILLSPPHLQRFGGEVVSALLSGSNFYFWGESGYFDTESHLKPLLHTWSLSVEEQFYLLWPATMLLLIGGRSNKYATHLIALGGLTSLYLAELWLSSDPAGAYYLAPFRVVEFAIGAFLVFAQHNENNGRTRETAALSGFALILIAIFAFDRHTSFPGLNALIPSVGAALVIYSGSASFINRVLAHRMLVGLGLISYSLYLVHWPIIAFLSYLKLGDLTQAWRIVIVGTSLAAAILLYFFVERPFRKRGHQDNLLTDRQFLAGCAVLATIVVLPAVNAWAGDGWRWRLSQQMADAVKFVQQSHLARTEAIRAPKCHLSIEGQTFAEYAHTLDACNALKGGSYVVVGDSYAADLWASLSKAYPAENFIQFTGTGCTPDRPRYSRCNELLAYAKEYIKENRQRIQGVLFSGRALFFMDMDSGQLTAEKSVAYLSYLQHAGVAVTWIGPHQEFDPDIPSLLSRAVSLEGFSEFANTRLNKRVIDADKRLAEIVQRNGINYLSIIDLFCAKSSCPIFTESSRSLYIDYGHWSVDGERHFGKILSGHFKSPEGLFRSPSL